MLSKEDIQKIGLFEDAIQNAINQVFGENPNLKKLSDYLIVSLASVIKLRCAQHDLSEELFLTFNEDLSQLMAQNLYDRADSYIKSVYKKTLGNSSEEEIEVYKKMMINISGYELIDLSVRRCLENHGIKYLGDLCVLNPGSLVNLKGFESPYLPILRRALIENGLDFCTNFKCWPTIRKQMENKK